jgi:DNA ligase-1
MSFKPLLAATLEDLETVKYPVIVSPKLDGLRCIVRNGQALSRNLKPFRNLHVQKLLSAPELEGLDGELIVGSPTEGHVLNRTQSGIMSIVGEPDFKFHVFDNVVDPTKPFQERLDAMRGWEHPLLELVSQTRVYSLDMLKSCESLFLKQGYEGMMLRDPLGPYKYGRSTLRERTLLKFKRFQDAEGIVVDIYEGVNNTNELTRAATGAAQRSHHQENMVKSGQVGTLIVRDLTTDARVNVSPGRMTHDMRQFYWEHPEKLLNAVVKYKFFDYGTLDAPRFATYQAHRDAEDMSHE